MWSLRRNICTVGFPHRGPRTYAAGIRDNGNSPLFRSAIGRTGEMAIKPMHRVDAYRMSRPPCRH